MKKRIGLIAFAGVLSCCPASAGDGFIEMFFGQYLQRTDAVTVGAGDAKEVNSATQTIDPWPPKVRDKAIPANGQRMTAAIQRYQDVRKLREAPPPIPPLGIYPGGVIAYGSSMSGGLTGSSGAPVTAAGQ